MFPPSVADDDGIVIEYELIDEELVFELCEILSRIETIAAQIGATFGFSKTQILVVEEDVKMLQILFSKSSSQELKHAEVTSQAKWLGCKVANTREGLMPERVKSLLGKSTSMISQFRNFCTRYCQPSHLVVRRQCYTTFIQNG